MADTNHQDDTNEMINNNDTNNEEEENYEDCSDDEDDDYDMPLTTRTLQGLKQNDPAVTSLYMNLHRYDGNRFFYSVDWIEDGDCISNNTQLKKLVIHIGGAGQQLQDFVSCIHRNHSIENIEFSFGTSIDDRVAGFIIEGLCGHPSLVRFLFRICGKHNKLGSMGISALGKVLKHPDSKLKQLYLPCCNIDDNNLNKLFNALAGNSTIKTLSLELTHHYDHIKSMDWRALSTVLQSPNCKLTNLSLNRSSICDDGANILGNALIGSSMKSLRLSCNRISSTRWQTFLDQLSQISIRRLDIGRNKIDDFGLAELANIRTLKSLDLCSNNGITPSGWQTFFNSLQKRGAQLTKLDISSNRIGDEDVATLGRLLSNMNTLKILNMSNMECSITSQGWIILFTSLHGSNLDLVKLYLRDNSIDDEGLQLLVRLVSSMSSLTHLNLESNQQATPSGWQALIGYLQSPNCVLVQLGLARNYINDDTVIAFANALAGNKTLKQLCLEDCADEDDDEDDNASITVRGWEAVSTLLCNKTSIMDTYNSNHVLQELSEVDYLPDDLAANSRLNVNKDKVEVAHQKILQIHFTEDATSNIQEFLDMELEVIPTAIAWIGRSEPIYWTGKNVSGLSTMFNLTRRLPDLFDSDVHTMKKSSSKRKLNV